MHEAPDWIAVDWGTSQLRAFAMSGERVLAEASSDEGMGRLAPDAFEPALLRLIEPWLGSGVTPVIACGMVGARQGWAEAPYRTVPCAPVAPGALMPVAARDPRLNVSILPGLCQADPADVMRGEETQIAGFLSLHPEFEGTLILPGTHSKHVRIAGGEVTGFATHMTGELFATLAQHTVLRHSVAELDGTAPEAFAEGLRMGRAGEALSRLFGLRAEALLSGLSPEEARARLSGLLIGAELAQLPASGAAVAIIGAGALAARYREALALLGIAAAVHDGAELVRRGLIAARAAEEEEAT
ncbi:2-dehydro-3-deoxygalactonokinase [Thioclava atlantica]|uniref:2-keto-3-deoxygalactonate kinase n=1 Tax=Thioclava atlantica TaxID=1317124 RepID=A0A085U0C0_9RHOB|nr:2-dehydro-3-deoxygalactonokinase [Thioclava atlantica]KFE36417.1 2-keto-3-deoxygalactonate kinase [Thioclava atlantica]